jgi:hypothetical protein
MYVCVYIYIQTLYVMYSLVHHLDQATTQPKNARAGDGARTRPTDSAHSDRADACPNEPIDPMHLRPHVSQPFSGFTQSFCYRVSHFAMMNSVILLPFCYSAQSFCDFVRHSRDFFAWPFCYSELNHFATVLSYFVILSEILKIFRSVSLLQ